MRETLSSPRPTLATGNETHLARYLPFLGLNFLSVEMWIMMKLPQRCREATQVKPRAGVGAHPDCDQAGAAKRTSLVHTRKPGTSKPKNKQRVWFLSLNAIFWLFLKMIYLLQHNSENIFSFDQKKPNKQTKSKNYTHRYLFQLCVSSRPPAFSKTLF